MHDRESSFSMSDSRQIDLQVSGGKDFCSEINIPGDKSISHRAIILSSVAHGHSIIKNFLMGEDTLATLRAMQSLGVNIFVKEQAVIVEGVGLQGLQASASSIDVGNAGTAMRLLTGLLAGQPFYSVLIGDASLVKRPMARIVTPLHQMGAKIAMTKEGTAPLQITGKQNLRGIHYVMPIASAQVKSCLLLAGLYADGKTTLIEPSFSRDHTERLLAAFSYPIEKNCYQISLEGKKELQGTEIFVPGDLSSAAFFVVAALITPGAELVIKNVGINSTRLGFLHILRLMGGKIDIVEKGEQSNEPIADLYIRYSALRGIVIPPQQVASAIDEFPILFIAAACAQGQTILKGAQELRFKESDRIATMAAGLSQLGIEVQVFTDGLAITGGELRGGVVESLGDHRVAMAFIIAANRAKDPLLVKNCSNIKTSFPNFVDLTSQLGLNIRSN